MVNDRLGPDREVLYEIYQLGNSVKITAIDGLTGIEVALVGPANITLYSLKANARRKLQKRLADLGLLD